MECSRLRARFLKGGIGEMRIVAGFLICFFPFPSVIKQINPQLKFSQGLLFLYPPPTQSYCRAGLFKLALRSKYPAPVRPWAPCFLMNKSALTFHNLPILLLIPVQ